MIFTGMFEEIYVYYTCISNLKLMGCFLYTDFCFDFVDN